MRIRQATHTLFSLAMLMLVVAGSVGCGGDAPPAIQESTPSLDGERINRFYSNEEIAYLLEIALWHDTLSSMPIIRQWRSDIVIGTKGSPTPEDLATLREVVRELDGLAREISITVAASDTMPSNLTVYYVPRGAFAFIRPDYTYPDFSFASLPNHHIIRNVDLLVATDSTTQHDRDLLTQRGLAASLGLANHSHSYPGSIFYFAGTTIPKSGFAPIDRIVIELLYSSQLIAGMERDDIVRALADR